MGSCLPSVSQMWDAMMEIRKKYLVAFVRIDQAHHGEPVTRRRIYIILVRRLRVRVYWHVHAECPVLLVSVSKFYLHKGCGFANTQDPHTFGESLQGNIQETDSEYPLWPFCATWPWPSVCKIQVQCDIWVFLYAFVNRPLSILQRTDLMLPEKCPYVNAIRKDFWDKTCKTREQGGPDKVYDLTKKLFSSI